MIRNRWRNKELKFKESVTFYSGIIGAIAIGTNIILPLLKISGVNITSDNIKVLQTITLILGLILGVFYLISISRHDAVKRSRDEFKELLENRRLAKKLLTEIFYQQLSGIDLIIDELSFNKSIKQWYEKSEQTAKIKNWFLYPDDFQSMYDEIGEEDFRFLLLTKSEEIGLITVNEIENKLIITLNLN